MGASGSGPEVKQEEKKEEEKKPAGPVDHHKALDDKIKELETWMNKMPVAAGVVVRRMAQVPPLQNLNKVFAGSYVVVDPSAANAKSTLYFYDKTGKLDPVIIDPNKQKNFDTVFAAQNIAANGQKRLNETVIDNLVTQNTTPKHSPKLQVPDWSVANGTVITYANSPMDSYLKKFSSELASLVEPNKAQSFTDRNNNTITLEDRVNQLKAKLDEHFDAIDSQMRAGQLRSGSEWADRQAAIKKEIDDFKADLASLPNAVKDPLIAHADQLHADALNPQGGKIQDHQGKDLNQVQEVVQRQAEWMKGVLDNKDEYAKLTRIRQQAGQALQTTHADDDLQVYHGMGNDKKEYEKDLEVEYHGPGAYPSTKSAALPTNYETLEQFPTVTLINRKGKKVTLSYNSEEKIITTLVNGKDTRYESLNKEELGLCYEGFRKMGLNEIVIKTHTGKGYSSSGNFESMAVHFQAFNDKYLSKAGPYFTTEKPSDADFRGQLRNSNVIVRDKDGTEKMYVVDKNGEAKELNKADWDKLKATMPKRFLGMGDYDKSADPNIKLANGKMIQRVNMDIDATLNFYSQARGNPPTIPAITISEPTTEMKYSADFLTKLTLQEANGALSETDHRKLHDYFQFCNSFNKVQPALNLNQNPNISATSTANQLNAGALYSTSTTPPLSTITPVNTTTNTNTNTATPPPIISPVPSAPPEPVNFGQMMAMTNPVVDPKAVLASSAEKFKEAEDKGVEIKQEELQKLIEDSFEAMDNLVADRASYSDPAYETSTEGSKLLADIEVVVGTIATKGEGEAKARAEGIGRIKGGDVSNPSTLDAYINAIDDTDPKKGLRIGSGGPGG